MTVHLGILALGRLRQEDHEFKVSLSYIETVLKGRKDQRRWLRCQSTSGANMRI